jgi:hypothetical protein
VPGVLSWDGGEAPTLELEGHIAPIRIEHLAGGLPLNAHEVIHGRTVEGGLLFSCFQCLYAGVTLGPDQHEGTDRFIVWDGALEGGHFAHEADALFTSYEATLTHLESWFPWTGMSETHANTADGNLARYSLAYEYPAENLQTDFGRATVRVSPGLTVSGPRRRRQPAERLTLDLDYDTPVTPRDAMSAEVEQLRKLMSVATLHSNAVEELRMTVAGDRGTRRGLWLSRRSPPSRLVADGHLLDSSLHPHEMLFNATDLPAERRGAIMAAWSSCVELYALTLNVLIQDIEAPLTAADSRLLLLSRAAEALHRRRYPVDETALARYQERMSTLRALITTPALWRWVRGLLSRAYEPSFEQRLQKLRRDVSTALDALIPTGPFAARLARHRNVYTHGDIADASALDQMQTFSLAVRAQYLLIAWLLVEIGFSIGETRAFLERNATYGHYVTQLPAVV